MATLCKFDQIVIRIMFSRELGARLHALYGDCELVLSLTPLRILQGDAPAAIRDKILQWASAHRNEVLADWRRYEASQHRDLAWGIA